MKFIEQILFEALTHVGFTAENYHSLLILRLALLAVAVLFSWLVYVLLSRAVKPLVLRIVEKTETTWDDYVFNEAALESTARLFPPLLLKALLPVVFNGASEQIGGWDWFASVFLSRAVSVYIVVAFILWAFAFVQGIRTVAEKHADKRSSYLTGIFQLIKILVAFVGAIIIIGIVIDESPLKLFAGLGAAATVLMLVFRDTIVGLVAGVQLSANDMLRKGDWITMSKYGADGTVEEVSLTTVKVRNFDNTITTIPPYVLTSDSFQNWRGMQQSGGRRVRRSLLIDLGSIRFCTPKEVSEYVQKGWLDETADPTGLVNVVVFRNAMEQMLRANALVNTDLYLMVRQLEPTVNGLPIEFYFFLRTKEWVPYEHQLHDILSQVVALVPQFGLRIFQAPSGRDIAALGTTD